MQATLRSLAFAVGLASAGFAFAEERVPHVIESGTAIVAFEGAPSGAAFLVIRNGSGVDDQLVGVRSDAAARVELHTHLADSDGVMRMREVEAGFPLPADGTIQMARGGDHIMMMGLNGVAPGDMIAVELVFASGAELQAEIELTLPTD